MELAVTQGNIIEQATDCIVVNLFAGVTSPAAQRVLSTPALVARSVS